MTCILLVDGDLQTLVYQRINHAHKEYVGGKAYVITTPPDIGSSKESVRVAVMHNIFVCTTTNELYFNVRFYADDIRQLEGFMPCLDPSTLQTNVDTVAYHRVKCIEAAVLHHQPSAGIAYVVKY